MKNTQQIHDTAFVTASYRASNEELSKDSYSKYWQNPRTAEWIHKILTEVSPDEPHTHCLRNRYFYETIKRLKKDQKIEVLINLGAGFSMYPFLFEEDLINIEIDKADNIHFKKKEIKKLQDAGKLPKRDIHYIARDFNLEKAELLEEIKTIVQARPSFVLIEGVIFFLSKKVTNEVFDLISQIQVTGSYVGSVSFLDSIKDTACFKRLIKFFQEDLASGLSLEYLTLATEYYGSLASYELIEHEDYVSLSKEYSPNNIFENGDLILNENMYLLKRN